MSLYKIKGFFLTLFSLITLTLSASNWEVPLTVSTAAPESTDEPIIVADNNDNAAVIWRQSGEIYTSYRPYAGDWEAPTNHGKGTFNYNIHMDDVGNITIAFSQGDVDSVLFAGFRPFGGVWSPTAEQIATVASAGETISDITISCLSNNFYGYICWFDSSAAPAQSVQTLYRRGAGSGTGGVTGWDTLTGPQLVHTGTHTANFQSNPIVKILSDGNATVMAKYTDPVEDAYSATTTTPGGSYASPILMGFSAAGSIEDFDFDMQPNGNAVVAVAVGNKPRVQSTTNPTVWPAAPDTVVTASDVTQTPSVGVDSNGLASIVYVTLTNDIEISHDTVPGTTWNSSTVVSGGTLSRPLIHVSSNGYRIVAWNDGAGDPSSLVALRGQNTTLEATSSIVDAEMQKDSFNIYTTNTSRGFATWLDSEGNRFAEASRTFEPIDETENLLRALGKKRLIYQQTRYP